MVREGRVQIVLMSPFGTFYNYNMNVNTFFNEECDVVLIDITTYCNYSWDNGTKTILALLFIMLTKVPVSSPYKMTVRYEYLIELC